MNGKTIRIDELPREESVRVAGLCLTMATVLGDYIDDLTVIGGLVPTLLVDQAQGDEDFETHLGTTDLDIGLSLGLLDGGRYEGMADRLRESGFSQDLNDAGNQTHQRWVFREDRDYMVDFLIPSTGDVEPGRTKHLEQGLAAIVALGLGYAGEERVSVRIEGANLLGARAERDIWVCDIPPYVILKSYTLRKRNRSKDSYDLTYILRQSLPDLDRIADSISRRCDVREVMDAVGYLRQEFASVDHRGPVMYAQHLTGGLKDADLQADSHAVLQSLLKRIGDRQ